MSGDYLKLNYSGWTHGLSQTSHLNGRHLTAMLLRPKAQITTFLPLSLTCLLTSQRLPTDADPPPRPAGAVEMENVPLRKDALASLDLPVRVMAGFVGKIRLSIPVRRLSSEPWSISIEQLYVVLGPVRPEEVRGRHVRGGEGCYAITDTDCETDRHFVVGSLNRQDVTDVWKRVCVCDCGVLCQSLFQSLFPHVEGQCDFVCHWEAFPSTIFENKQSKKAMF